MTISAIVVLWLVLCVGFVAGAWWRSIFAEREAEREYQQGYSDGTRNAPRRRP